MVSIGSASVAAIRASDQQPPAVELAKAQFAIARRSLIAADLLRPDRQSDAELRRALEQANGVKAEAARLLGLR